MQDRYVAYIEKCAVIQKQGKFLRTSGTCLKCDPLNVSEKKYTVLKGDLQHLLEE